MRTRDSLAQLIEELAPHARELVRKELAKRPAWSQFSEEGIVQHAYRGQEKKTSYLTQQTVEARFRIPADARRPATAGGPVPWRIRRAAFHS